MDDAPERPDSTVRGPAATDLREVAMSDGLRVLLAEDDEELRRLLRELLGRIHARVVEAASGSDLLHALAADGPFELVVTDIRMPPPDGLRSLSLARAVGIDTPFLVLTAFGDGETRARVAELGRSEQLDKPFDGDEFLRRVRRLVRLPADTSTDPGRRAAG